MNWTGATRAEPGTCRAARVRAGGLAALLLLVLPGVVGAAGTVERSGDVLQILIPAAGLGATLFYEDGWEGTVDWGLTLGVSAAVTEALKAAVDRSRPNGGCCNSFPSGHATAAFAGAAFIDRRYGRQWAWPAWAGAAWVAYSRVQADKHHVEDVVAGAAIGVAAAWLFTDPWEAVSIRPVAGAGMVGLRAGIRW